MLLCCNVCSSLTWSATKCVMDTMYDRQTTTPNCAHGSLSCKPRIVITRRAYKWLSTFNLHLTQVSLFAFANNRAHCKFGILIFIQLEYRDNGIHWPSKTFTLKPREQWTEGKCRTAELQCNQKSITPRVIIVSANHAYRHACASERM